MYDNTNASPTNRVTLTGRISSEPRYSHEIYGEAFYEFSLEVKRLSDMADTLPSWSAKDCFFAARSRWAKT